MCRGFQQNDRERLKIKSFYANLFVSSSHVADSLTLYFLPRINGSALEVNGSNIRPDSPAFITLHRVVSPKTKRGVIYGSREKVKGSEGLRFEIYMGDVKIMKGLFRKFEGQKWKLDCTSQVEGDDVAVKAAEICVAVEDIGGGMISEKVEMKVKRRRGGKCVKLLEEIPEEREGENEFELEEECCCCECLGEVETDCEDEEVEDEVEGEMEGVRWAVDVGIWVVCLGVGYLVTKASSRKMRRRKRLIS